MKLVKTISLVLFAIMALSCSSEKEENKITTDYTTLGIEKVIICNKTFYPQTNSILPDISKDNQVALTGIYNDGKKIELSYVYLVQSDETPSLDVKSKYPETSVLITEGQISGSKTITATLTKIPEPKEIKYIISFLKK